MITPEPLIVILVKLIDDIPVPPAPDKRRTGAATVLLRAPVSQGAGHHDRAAPA